MDPMTQSSQISSSQGFGDGQNSAAKETKLSDKRVVLGSDKPSEGVATSLRFSSQPGSFSPGNYGGEAGPPDGQPDSPIKASPVSERIKALEALAAKKKEPDFRTEGGFSHFRDRNHEKSPTEQVTFSLQKKRGSADLESPGTPESPFEVLGDLGQVSEFENTADWMRAHLPPAPDFDDAEDLSKDNLALGKNSIPEDVKEPVVPDIPIAFAGIPDAFPDSPVKAAELKGKSEELPEQPSAEEESEFDLSFLPTAVLWDQQEKHGIQSPQNPDPVLPSSPVPPEAFHSAYTPLAQQAVTDAQHKDIEVKETLWGVDLEPTEAPEMDSSGESDDTVIEDGAPSPGASNAASSVLAPSNDPTPNPSDSSLPNEEKVTPPLRTERKLMQVPTINVIETDEPNYSEEEMEMELEEDDEQSYEVVKDPTQDPPKTPEPQPGETEAPITRPLETEFMEGYSPPSSPVDSDAEYSPKHKIPRSESDVIGEVSAIKMAAVQNTTEPKDLSDESPQAQPEKSPITSTDEPPSQNAKPTLHNEEVDFPDNEDEWSDEAQDIIVKPEETVTAQTHHTPYIADEKINANEKEGQNETSLSKPCFVQDDLYDRRSFDDDYDASPVLADALDEKDLTHVKRSASFDAFDTSQIVIESLSASATKNETPQDNLVQKDVVLPDDDEPFPKPVGGQPSPREYPKDPYSSFQSEQLSSKKDMGVIEKRIGDNAPGGDSIRLEDVGERTQIVTAAGCHTSDTSDPESIEPDCSVSGATDSFVEFMKECLKSRDHTDPVDTAAARPGPAAKNEQATDSPPSQSPPAMVMDIEQEQLTINALKQLGSSQEEEALEEMFAMKPSVEVCDQDKTGPIAIPAQQMSLESTFHPPPLQANPATESAYSKEVEAIDEWVAEAYHLAEHVLTAILTHLSVKDLIHWRDPKKSGVVFGLSMLLLLSLAAFSVISVASYLLLALLCVTITFRIYKSVVQAVQKSSDGHPFKALMDKDVSIPPETFRKHVDVSLTYINRGLKQLSRLFLVEDLIDSLKLAVVMWLLTYVGAVFNGITILILADILLFAVPPVYEKNKAQIDQYMDVARTQVNSTIAKLQEKLPGAVKRSKTE